MKLNVEQRRIIENKPNGHALVRGVAGSGKTTVAVHKIPFLLKNYCYENDDKVLVVTYNKSLINYVRYIYSEIEKYQEEEQLAIGLYESDNKNKLDIRTIDSIMYRYFSLYMKRNKIGKLNVATQQQITNSMIEAITKVKEKYEEVKALNSKNLIFIKEEICWIKACNYMNIEEYQNVDRLGRTASNNGDGPQKLRKNSKVREAIFEVMLQYNENLSKDNLVDFQDIALMALEEVSIKAEKKYTHIIIDETQDLTKVQLEFIQKLYMDKNYSSMLFVSDNAQSIYPHAWMVKGRSFSSIGLDMKGKSTSLSKNYRTTTQIAQAAYSLIQNDINIVEDDNFVKPSLIDKQGVYPVYRDCKNKSSEADYIVNLISDDLKDKYSYKDIAIVSKLKNQLHEIKIYLGKNNIPYKELNNNDEIDFNDNSIKLMTMHSIKGLEFKVVMIIGLNDKCIPLKSVANEFEDSEFVESRDRKLLYVGMTRATEQLFLTSDGNPSKFIKEISYKYLRVNTYSNFRRLHRVNIDEYLYADKIVDIYSNEEVIRQWVIDELINTYSYSKEMIDVEYKANLGSKSGLVDIVIYIYKNKSKIPFIFIEVKRWGMGIERAVPQLQSYMSSCNTVAYGIATDGNELIIINNEFEKVNDIPVFNSNMLPASIETYEYMDLSHGRCYEFMRDSSNEREIIVEDDDEAQVIGIPVFNEIAAGAPIFINNDLQGAFYLSNEWIKSPEETFILRIKGDSMINANINDGDLVVIRKQASANNNEIVAVDIDGNATLKRLMIMGSNVILIPENNDYEPIMLPAEEVRIIGVAVGIVKDKN